MRVRVHDKATNRYFKSEVYAIINTGIYCKYLVLAQDNNKVYLKLFNEYDISDKSPVFPPNINTITIEKTETWVQKKDSSLLKIISLLNINKNDLKFYYYYGYAWLFEESQLLADLIEGHAVEYEKTSVKDRKVSSIKEGWNYIESEANIKELHETFSGFHDSCLKSLHYVSGAEVFEDGSMAATDSIRQVTMYFDSQWCNSIEMIFEGVLAMNLRPAQDGYDSIIFSASIIIKDETIFFCDDEMQIEDLSYKGTCIKALGLRWRQID